MSVMEGAAEYTITVAIRKNNGQEMQLVGAMLLRADGNEKPLTARAANRLRESGEIITR